MNNQGELVSIVLPVFNGVDYIKESLNSLIKQTHQNLEILVIDDGSTDDTVKLIKETGKSDRRIKLFQREHKGLIETLRFGIGMANGKYIARMDADDISHKERIERQIKRLKSKKADITGCSFFVIDDSSYLKRHFEVPSDNREILVRLATSVPFCHGSVLAKAKILKEYLYGKGGNSEVEDYTLWTIMARDGVKFTNCRDALYYLRINSNSLTIAKGSLVPKARLKVALRYISDSQEDLIHILSIGKLKRDIKEMSGFVAGDYLFLLKIMSRYHKLTNRFTLSWIRVQLYLKYSSYLLNSLMSTYKYMIWKKKL